MKAFRVALAAALLVSTLGATAASAYGWHGHKVCHSVRHHHHWERHCHWVH